MTFHSKRRSLLKAGGLSAAALAALSARKAFAQSDAPPNNSCGNTYNYKDTTLSFNELYDNPPLLGRVHGAYWIRIFAEPSPNALTVCSANWGYIMPIYRGLRTEPYDARAASDLWFETNVGWVHSAYVVPSHERFQQPIAPEDFEEPFWGEITVPLSWQHQRPHIKARQWDWDYYKAIYQQVHKVIDITRDDEGYIWYRLYDDAEEKRWGWVLGKHVRPIGRDEFDPISQGVPNKHIYIDLGEQTLSAYEGDILVFRTRIASGSSFSNDEGELVDFSTVKGDYLIERKRPSRRMRGGRGSLAYDVNAVPWCTYFGHNGAAIHGAYWHNNFGTPRSHGCINVTPDAAKWIYRWTQPHYGYDIDFKWREEGEPSTLVRVI